MSARVTPVVVALTKAEREAVARAQLTVGHGVRRSKALVSAERKLHDAIRAAQAAETDD